jgi:hypothetical protein
MSAQNTARERFPAGMSLAAQEVWRRPLNAPGPVKLPGGSIDEPGFESHLLDCFGMYCGSVHDFRSAKDYRC